ncbi:MAG: 4Fe-4S dicluster domain-containing protein [Thermoanaerobacteraceae bacterium]|nr:4Fe-4S dicluster domain-containing protein [Thermoanaerobacteraceae bacterium]
MEAIKLSENEEQRSAFTRQVRAESGQPVENCYQCGKCSAGCPVAFAYDFMPHQIMRLVQLGLRDEVLKCQSIWLCASCVTCTARCPRNIDVAAVMDTLRIMARRRGISAPGRGRNVALFNSNFLGSIRRYGRLFEFATMALFNLKSGQPFKDLETGLTMLRKGKLKLTVHRPRGMEEIHRIFDNVNRTEREG